MLKQEVLERTNRCRVGRVNCCWSSPEVILGSESRGTQENILVSRLWESCISSRSPTFLPLHTEYLIRYVLHRKHCVQQQQFFCCSVCSRCSRNVFTEPLPTNDRGWGYTVSHTDSKVTSQVSFYFLK
jgi:hypothetical protein